MGRQKSSGNANDLRGKILRVTPQPDGTVKIPEGNLFEDVDHGARSEVYVMGNRNPFRISVDPKTGDLYWGEVGPDAGGRRDGRGPAGYDEINQARGAEKDGLTSSPIIGLTIDMTSVRRNRSRLLLRRNPSTSHLITPASRNSPLPNRLSFITPIFRLCVGRRLTPVADARRWPVRSTTLTKISIRLTSCQKNSTIRFSSMNGHATGSST